MVTGIPYWIESGERGTGHGASGRTGERVVQYQRDVTNRLLRDDDAHAPLARMRAFHAGVT
jgi:hypothetical protein